MQPQPSHPKPTQLALKNHVALAVALQSKKSLIWAQSTLFVGQDSWELKSYFGLWFTACLCRRVVGTSRGAEVTSLEKEILAHVVRAGPLPLHISLPHPQRYPRPAYLTHLELLSALFTRHPWIHQVSPASPRISTSPGIPT